MEKRMDFHGTIDDLRGSESGVGSPRAGRSAVRTAIRIIDERLGGLPPGSLLLISDGELAFYLCLHFAKRFSGSGRCLFLSFFEDEESIRRRALSLLRWDAKGLVVISGRDLANVKDLGALLYRIEKILKEHGRCFLVLDRLNDMFCLYRDVSIKDVLHFMSRLKSLLYMMAEATIAVIYDRRSYTTRELGDEFVHDLSRICDCVIELREERVNSNEISFISVYGRDQGLRGERYVPCVKIEGVGLVPLTDIREGVLRVSRDVFLKLRENNAIERGFDSLELPILIPYDEHGISYLRIPTNRLVTITRSQSMIEFTKSLYILILHALRDGFDVLYVSLDDVADTLVVVGWDKARPTCLRRDLGSSPLVVWARRRRSGASERGFTILDARRSEEPRVGSVMWKIVDILKVPGSVGYLCEYIRDWSRGTERGQLIIIDSLLGLISLTGDFESALEVVNELTVDLISENPRDRVLMVVVPTRSLPEDQVEKVRSLADCIIEFETRSFLGNELCFVRFHGDLEGPVVGELMPITVLRLPTGIVALKPEILRRLLDEGLITLEGSWGTVAEGLEEAPRLAAEITRPPALGRDLSVMEAARVEVDVPQPLLEMLNEIIRLVIEVYSRAEVDCL